MAHCRAALSPWLLVPVLLVSLASGARSFQLPQERTPELDVFQGRSGPYLGEAPPGFEPVIFAPGVVSTGRSEGSIVFAPDGRSMVFQRYGSPDNMIFVTREVAARWTIPEVAPPFARRYRYDGDFSLSPDGTRLFFTSRRLLDGEGEQAEDSGNIWVAEWRGDQWPTTAPLPPPIRTPGHEGYPSLMADGTLYFFGRGRPSEGLADIFLSKWNGQTYEEPESIGPPINTPANEWDPYVAPDGSYLLFASMRPGGLGEDDFYVAFRREDGSWTEPVNMGEGVNSPYSENRPFVTLDGKYFFFTSNRPVSSPGLQEPEPHMRPGNGSRDIYWVDAQLIEGLRPASREVPGKQ